MKVIFLLLALNFNAWMPLLHAEGQDALQSGYSIQDSAESDFIFPMKHVSFADTVILYDAGAMGENTGGEPDTSYQHSKYAIGSPDDKSVCLGSGGTLIIQFTDNVLIDGPGPDLFIFQTDTIHEELQVWISDDGLIYYPAGKTFSSISYLDIHDAVESNGIYSYVKIRDNADQGENSGSSLGGDIDAIGAVHTARKILVPSDLVFTGINTSWTDQAFKTLESQAEEFMNYPKTSLMIFVHTAAGGTPDFNRIISQQRAGAIRSYFIDNYLLEEDHVTAVGLGNEYPVTAEPDTSLQSSNRRIEFFLYPEHLQFPLPRP